MGLDVNSLLDNEQLVAEVKECAAESRKYLEARCAESPDRAVVFTFWEHVRANGNYFSTHTLATGYVNLMKELCPFSVDVEHETNPSGHAAAQRIHFEMLPEFAPGTIVGARPTVFGRTYYFNNEKDAFMFKLRFG